ncbi:hypothetical protein BKA66DRAFT_427779 [Pyrenochaeta sp. MPI-SDFR-AT-0127]|nr:hypothetical protein BKA66DRAFT_427779 [Pyrenochaeta sp. MPI-SDFR-AT-0127]
MRYDDWDVILFPKDSHVPIQEFKTACYVSPDESGRQLPTLTCYISSLSPSTPFRISIHSWATAAKPSAYIESRRKANQKVVYIVKVIVDGARVFHGFFDIASRWPQEIAHEKKSLTLLDHPTSQRRPCLGFPSFHQQTLGQSSWDPRDTNGRINIMLSEQLISKMSGSEELDIAPNVQMQSPTSHSSKSTFTMPQKSEPRRRPHSHLPPISQFAQPLVNNKANGRAGVWENCFAWCGDSADNASMDTWSTKRTASNSTGDMNSDHMYKSSYPSYTDPLWSNGTPRCGHVNKSVWGTQRSSKGTDSQLGQNVKVISPPKRTRELPHGFGSRYQKQTGRPPTTHAYFPPKMRAPLINRSSSAALARTSSYPDFKSVLRNTSNKQSADTTFAKDNISVMYHPSMSSNKENCPPPEYGLLRSYLHGNRVPTPDPFAQRLQNSHSDVSSMNLSSVFSSFSRFDQNGTLPLPVEMGKPISAHIPSIAGNVKSRKEGMANESPNISVHGIRHDQSLMHNVDGVSGALKKPNPKSHNKRAYNFSKSLGPVEIIDVDAIDADHDTDRTLDKTELAPFKLNHKPGMSSIDSTGRLEQQLFSALGEELGSFDQQTISTSVVPELRQTLGGTTVPSNLGGSSMLNPSASEFEPTTKRKRQATLNGERSQSPTSKKQSGQLEAEEVREDVVLRLRGD